MEVVRAQHDGAGIKPTHGFDLAERVERLAELVLDRDRLRAKVSSIIEAVEARGDDHLDRVETGWAVAMDSWRRQIDRELDELGIPDPSEAAEALDQMRQRLDDIAGTEESRAAALTSAERYGGTKVTKVRVGNEPGVYRKDGEHSFFRDMAAARVGDPLAAERLARHARGTAAETRDVDTSGMAGLVIPQYLVDDYAPVARQGRPFADFVSPRRLPSDGMTMNIPRGNTGTLVTSQTSQNSAVSERDLANTDIVVPVVTIAGQNDISRQALDRSRNADQEVMGDLAEAYTAELDRQLFSGTGANTQHLGILSMTTLTTITVTSTSGVTQIRQIAGGASSVHSNRYLPAQVIVVHPRRWAYWSQATDSNGRPLVTPNPHGPQNAFGVGDLTVVGAVVGDLYGIPVLTDPNIPTTLSYDVTQSSTTDPIIVTRASDLRLYEDDPLPRRVRFEETLAGSLSVKVVAWGYSAWTAARYTTATVILAGSGLTTPAFG